MKPVTMINIDGETLYNFEKVTLKQAINTHHTFSLEVDYDTIETVGSYTLDESREWLGKSIVINFDDTDFLGVITNVALQHANGFEGKLLVTGYSKTILLENGKHLQSWLQKNLSTIVKDTTMAAGLIAKIKPAFKPVIDYQAQYNESHFQFLQRLAKQYNEWLYYDGVQIVFGKPSLEEAIKIEYGADMDSLKIAIKAIPSTVTSYEYNALQNVRDETATRGRVEGLNELGSHAFDISKELFAINTNENISTKANNKSEIDTFVRNQQASKIAKANVLTATSTKQGLTVGTVLKVTGAVRKKKEKGFEVKSYGEFIIIKIKHTATGSSEYSNEFEAISSGTVILPEPKVALPQAATQIATVLSNEDPKQKGRVQVQFQWQKHQQRTSWIRVMTPDAGSSEHHEQNRGHVFIPEQGDQVMVGFHNNDPNQPFVMGSLFHGYNGAGGGTDNTLKTIITKSGHKIEFNDTRKQESISITDRNENSIFLDTVNKRIKIKAFDKIDLTANDIELNASNNLIFNASNNTEFNVSNNFIINAMSKLLMFTPYLKQTVSGFMHLFSGKALINSLNSINIESKEVQTLGTKKVFIHSDTKTIINSKGVAEMHGNKKNNFTNKAVSAQVVPPEEISLAVVEFRTEQGVYNGEFGFDWLRIDDNNLTTEKKYEDIINGGYFDGVTDLSKVDAFAKLQREYDNIPIKSKNNQSTMASNYYVPYLNLYSKPISLSVKTDPIKPPYKAKLRVLVTIEEDLDKLEFDYDKTIFTINRPILTKKTASTSGKETDGTIEITCNKTITTEEKGEIKVYAYPKGSTTKTPAEQLILRKLAGKIKVGRNDKGGRKKKQFVLVSVKTNIKNRPASKVGAFILSERDMLQKALYQSLVYAGLTNGPELDLSRDANFQIRTNAAGVDTYGKFIYRKKLTDGIDRTDGNIHEDHPGIFKYVQDLFFKQNPKYTGYYTIFCFNENTYDSYYVPATRTTTSGGGAVLGQVQKVGIENVFLFNGVNGVARGSTTMAHEVLHGLALHHTHKNSTPNKNIDRKYTFDKYETDNFMAYTKQAAKTKRSLWKWQWDIVRNNI